MPKHVALGIAVHHMKRSKQLITAFSRMGPCSTYDDVEAMDTSIANEIFANSDVLWVVLSQTFPLVCLYRLQVTIMKIIKTLLT